VLAMKTFARNPGGDRGSCRRRGRARAMEFAIDYAKRRQASAHRSPTFQAIQHKIADMFQKVEPRGCWSGRRPGRPIRVRTRRLRLPSPNCTPPKSRSKWPMRRCKSFAGYGYTKMFPDREGPARLPAFPDLRGHQRGSAPYSVRLCPRRLPAVMPPLEDLPIHLDKTLSIWSGDDHLALPHLPATCITAMSRRRNAPSVFFRNPAFKKV